MYGDSNNILVVPVTTLMRQYKSNQVNSLTAQSESSVISGIGGIIGVGLGIDVSTFVCKMMKFSYVFNPTVIIGAFVFSLGVGIFFGLYPANKASKLRPVDALRFE